MFFGLQNSNFSKFCCIDLTIASRWIGFLGLLLSTGLITILAKDSLAQNYNYSRHIALILGLDWNAFHHEMTTSRQAEPDGTISLVVTFYTVAYLATSLSLIFATIACNRWCSAPWLICELCSCVSKSIAMIYHSLSNDNSSSIYYSSSNIFIIGSVCYIVAGSWCWLVVYNAQLSWRVLQAAREVSTTFATNDSSSLANNNISLRQIVHHGEFTYRAVPLDESIKTESTTVLPDLAYVPNSLYGEIGI